MKLLVLICLNMSNLNMLKERKPKVCLTKGSVTGCDTRWRGLESHALHRDKERKTQSLSNQPSDCIFSLKVASSGMTFYNNASDWYICH